MERFMNFNQGKDDTIEPAYMKNFSGSNNGQSELPTVTTEDNGKVLTVVDGAWNKADASGGGNEPFVIEITATGTGERKFTTNLTQAQFNDAYDNYPERIVLHVTDGANKYFIRDIICMMSYGMRAVSGGIIHMGGATSITKTIVFNIIAPGGSQTECGVSYYEHELYGNVYATVPSAGSVNNGKVMTVVNGVWKAENLPD